MIYDKKKKHEEEDKVETLNLKKGILKMVKYKVDKSRVTQKCEPDTQDTCTH